MHAKRIMTREEARNDLDRKGISVRRWALENGFNPITVHLVLNGKRQCRIGVTHNIGVTLGIKDGEIVG